VKPTIAIIDAYGYAALESDLAMYRATFGLSACSISNGCLRIVNQAGQASPLPAGPPADDDWTIETALDVDMASAMCPNCDLLVIQGDDPTSNGMLIAQNTAAQLGASVISDSWGGPESPPPDDPSSLEVFFNHPGIATFVAGGDDGFDDQLSANGTGPDYPGTSAFVISVGGTHLVKDTSARGWHETTWAPVAGNAKQGAGGSACSLSIAKPAYQTASPCAFKATTDVAAVADPATGLAVYNAANGGWLELGGTSAAAPMVAALFAAAGLGAEVSGAYLATNAANLNDVTTGSNGTCGTDTLLCNAAVGWDGPTGYGTPNAKALAPAAPVSSGGSNSTSGSDGPADITGGCAVGGATPGFGAALGFALLAVRRRRARSARA
jgi:subtilase family serine protease